MEPNPTAMDISEIAQILITVQEEKIRERVMYRFDEDTITVADHYGSKIFKTFSEAKAYLWKKLQPASHFSYVGIDIYTKAFWENFQDYEQKEKVQIKLDSAQKTICHFRLPFC